MGTVLGVTLDGVRIGGSAPIDPILGNYTIGAFDPCGGHVNPQEGYHMHATTGCSDSTEAVSDGETALFGYALDGFGMYAPYAENVEATADLDECNGHETDQLGYHYPANQVAENAVLTCFSGVTTAWATDRAGGGPPVGDQAAAEHHRDERSATGQAHRRSCWVRTSDRVRPSLRTTDSPARS